MSAPIKYTLSKPQAELLAAMLSAHGPASMNALADLLGLGRSIVNKRLVVLQELNLATATGPEQRADGQNGRSAMLFAITRPGRRALARHLGEAREAELVIVPAGRINLFDLPVMAPPPRVYYRNEGNKHIASRGYSC